MALTILITGFGPFPGAPVNPTARLVARLSRRQSGSAVRRVGHVFRTSYAAVDAELPLLIARYRPDVVLLFGLAARTAHVRIETRAVNGRSVLSPDVDGVWPARRTIDPAGPAWLAARAPQRRLLAAARASGVPVKLSRDAGRYVCNFSYWRALEAAARRDGPRVVQFVHVPLIRSAATPWHRGHRRQPTLADLERTGEAMLPILAAAARDTPSRLAVASLDAPPASNIAQPVAAHA